MANPHFQNLILWAGNTVASKSKKDLPMFQPYPSDQTYYGYFNDFMTYNSGDWTITTTEAGTGSATEAVTSSAGGALLLTNAAGDNDLDFLQLKGEAFRLAAGKRAFFSSRFKVSDATQSDFVMGLHITDTSPLDVTDGIYFIKSDGAATVDLAIEKNNTATTASSIATMANDTFITLSWFIDPNSSNVHYSVNNAEPLAQPFLVDTNFPNDEDLTISFGIQNGEAVAKTMTVDYINVMVER
jgi:hypothetical protein